jgi:hypothetical protein
MDELTVEDWVRERLDNCQRLAAGKVGADRDGWLEDARYFSRVLARMDALGTLFAACDAPVIHHAKLGPQWLAPAMDIARAALASDAVGSGEAEHG